MTRDEFLLAQDFHFSTHVKLVDYYVANVADLAAAFTEDQTSGVAPLTVQFTDASDGIPSSWLWDFGDGETSTEASPEHIYAEAGTYTVTLSVRDQFTFQDTLVAVDHITASES